MSAGFQFIHKFPRSAGAASVGWPGSVFWPGLHARPEPQPQPQGCFSGPQVSMHASPRARTQGSELL